MISSTTMDLVSLASEVCPKAPPGADQPVADITGYVIWGVRVLLGLGLLTGVGGVVAGRVFSMPHASKVAIIGIVVVLGAAIALLVLPGILDGVSGSGCVNVPGVNGTPAPSPTGK
ncbi:hypothetical protein [Luteipulveratus halotolerans]|uniref:Uncharacterized protein n=1 Tax=Luteipulveratus halotolerans TaxID=1631356 RepID=A0A0L6CED9_9MICO|nr:hypothetical protein [Luteipulveratus halotolerans]KNX35873.1 hypothetical protein VV01_21625 [Luteipulveratus halotolerans]